MSFFPIRFQVNKQVEASLKKKHPWVFRNQCSSAINSIAVGSFVRLVGAQNNFLALGLYDPHAAVSIRVIAFSDEDLSVDYFAQKIREAFSRRKLNLKHYKTNAYRLLHGEADFFPGLNVDVFDETAIIVPYLKSWEVHLKDVWPLVAKELGISEFLVKEPHGGIVRMLEENSRTHERTNARSHDLEPLWFTESGHHYPSFPSTGLKTGFFLDLRDVRLFLYEFIKPKMRVLNLFANDGVFSAIAVKNKAEVVSVERHEASREHAKILFEKWNLPFDDEQWVVDDVWDYLSRPSTDLFDLIIIDPPSLGSKKGQDHIIERAWKKLHGTALKLLKANGSLLSISCTDRITRDQHIEWTQGALRASALGGLPLLVRNEWTETFDHPQTQNLPERSYFRAILFK